MRAAQHKKQIQIVHINDPFITDLKYMQYMFYVSSNQIFSNFRDSPKIINDLIHLRSTYLSTTLFTENTPELSSFRTANFSSMASQSPSPTKETPITSNGEMPELSTS